jgi:GR25 family glycosyltransferase involved in LPS biosynthesis
MKTYVINLDHRTDRLAAAQVAINNMGVEGFIRVPAIDTRSQVEFPKEQVLDESMAAIRRGHRLEHHELTTGAVGCYLSHMKCWSLLKDSGDAFALILEDDVVFRDTPEDFDRIVSIGQAELADGLDIFLLGHTFDVAGPERAVSIEKFYCNHAYLISASACDKLLRLALPMKSQLDSFMSKLNHAGVLRTKAMLPLFVRQSNFDTDIQLHQPYQGV